ncbi:MAG: tetratricopeptide repeat protein [Prevotella sp.]|nr:tetratricopeptide repeat protein [Prevotella sp.]
MEKDYFRTDAFLAILADYEDCQKRGVPCIISSEDYADIAEYYQVHDADLKRAEETIDTAIKLYPGSTDPLAFKARMCLLKGNDTEGARRWAEQIEDKNDLEYCYVMAEILIVENKLDDVDIYLRDWQSQIDDEEEAFDFIYDVATLLCDYNLMDEADKWIEQIEEKTDPYYEEVKARILVNRGEFEEGERLLNKLLDADPFCTKHWDFLATSQFQRAAYRESIDSCEFAMALNPNDDEAIFNKANGLYQLGNYHDAMEYYTRYVRLQPDDEMGELFLGMCLLSENRVTEAEEHLKKAEELAVNTKRNQFPIFQELAFTESRLGKLDDALDYIEKTETLDCDHNEMLVVRGHILLEHGHIEEAQDCFSKAVTLSDASPHIFLRIAVSTYDNGYLPLAQKMLTSLLANVDKENWNEGYSYLAACYHERGNKKEWLNYLRLAVEKNPTEAMNVLADFFPPDMDPKDYYQYASEE